ESGPMIETAESIQLANQRDHCVQLVSEHYQPLYRWFLWLTNTNGVAADLTQDTFVAVWQSLDRFDASRPFKPWLFGIARNVFRKHCAGQQNAEIERSESGGEEPDPDPSPAQVLLSKEAGSLLDKAVARLPNEYREVVVLRFWEDLDYGEIAEALAISEGLARWRVHQGRKILLQKLSKAGLTAEQLFRSGAKFGWWLRLHKRRGPSPQLLERCIATIPSMEPSVSIGRDEQTALATRPSDGHPSSLGRPLQQNSMKTHVESVRVGTLKELKTKGCAVVRLDQAVAVFHSEGKVFAVENRCPHMGFPLHRGSVENGMLTCYWHHARFDLTSGCTFDL